MNKLILKNPSEASAYASIHTCDETNKTKLPIDLNIIHSRRRSEIYPEEMKRELCPLYTSISTQMTTFSFYGGHIRDGTYLKLILAEVSIHNQTKCPSIMLSRVASSRILVADVLSLSRTTTPLVEREISASFLEK